MDTWGADAEEYIAAIRAGAIDPFGRSAAQLQATLDEFDEELTECILALSDDEVEQLARTGGPIPAPARVPESEVQQRLRLDEEFVGRMLSLEAQSARVEGERRALIAAHMRRMLELPGDAGQLVKELASMAAVELGESRGAMLARMTDAYTIVTELPAAHEAAAAGRITRSHLRTVERETRPLRADTAVAPAERARVVDALVEAAERCTSSQLASKAKRIVNDALSEPLQIRHTTARQRRRVELFDVGDGMCDLVARVPALEGVAILDRLTQAARKKPKDDPRTFDQFRADALQELLLAGVVPEDLHGASSITAHVALTIPATELLRDPVEQDERLQRLRFPAALDGRVLVDRETARRIAGDTATWERLFTDPVSGVAVTVDTYRAKPEQRKWLAARDGRCRSPWCDHPVLRADLDHTKDFAAGGTTSIDNLGHLCRSDHMLKHGSRWRVEQLPGGVLRWTSPIGQVIDDVPEPVGPVFTEMPRSKPKSLTRSERRRRDRELGRLTVSEPDRVHVPGTVDAVPWGTSDLGPSETPLPF